jgi:uncharacterized protein (TIGR02246 family)
MIRTMAIPVAVALSLVCLQAGAVVAAGPTGDEAAIRNNINTYVEAYNRGDAKAIAELWAEKGVWATPAGKRLEGRQAIHDEMKTQFAAIQGPKPRLEVVAPVVRLLTPAVAVEEGCARLVLPGEEPLESSYLAVHVKRDGRWQLESIHETTVPPPVSEVERNDELDQLDWLVGRWVDEDEHTRIETTCEWTLNRQFLSRSFLVAIDGRPNLTGTQIIGWDAATKQFRSWMFDSEGSFAEGVWTRHDNQWIAKVKQTLRDGRLASSITVMTRVDDNAMTWQSTNREVDGQMQPNQGPVTVRRQ